MIKEALDATNVQHVHMKKGIGLDYNWQILLILAK